MQTTAYPQSPTVTDRVGWVDYAKGICILLVVLFHTVNHYEEAVGATGWMRWMLTFEIEREWLLDGTKRPFLAVRRAFYAMLSHRSFLTSIGTASRSMPCPVRPY